MESKAKRRVRAIEISAALRVAYPDAACSLEHKNPFQLLAATILSAQCTDARVNLVTPALFSRFPDAAAMSEADLSELEELVRTTGFFRNKAKNLKAMAAQIAADHKGEVPGTLEELQPLPGVGRKTANVVLGNCFGIPGLTVDTHMQRVNQRLGLTRESDPVKIERDLMELIPQTEWTHYSHRVIEHGRATCTARRPYCERCPLTPWCDYFQKWQRLRAKAG